MFSQLVLGARYQFLTIAIAMMPKPSGFGIDVSTCQRRRRASCLTNLCRHQTKVIPSSAGGNPSFDKLSLRAPAGIRRLKGRVEKQSSAKKKKKLISLPGAQKKKEGEYLEDAPPIYYEHTNSFS